MLYRCRTVSPVLALEEVCASERIQAGSVFVDMAARDHLKRKFAYSKFGSNEYITDIIGEFERKTVDSPSGFGAVTQTCFLRDGSLTALMELQLSSSSGIPRTTGRCRSRGVD